MKNAAENKVRNPWLWIPTLYFAEGIPYFIVNQILCTMLTKMGVSNGVMALYTSMIYLPWVLKPLWSPFVDLIKTKRWWITTMQIIMSVAFVFMALSLPRPELSEGPRAALESVGWEGNVPALLDAARGSEPAFQLMAEDAGNVLDAWSRMSVPAGTPISLFSLTLILFWIVAFASSTHDIAADGFYMLALDENRQSLFVGIRSTFYRLSSIFGQGILVVIAGVVEQRYHDIPLSWEVTLGVGAVLFALITIYHLRALPHPAEDHERLHPDLTARGIARDFVKTFVSFFRKPHVLTALVFMLLFRLPEALLLKMMNPFMLHSVEEGGLGMTTTTFGLIYGTIGVAALTLGGILGGVAASSWGLKKSLWPMALSLALPSCAFLILSIFQPQNLWLIGGCVVLDQFGYGFGFTAYMLYLIYFSEGEFKTAHYSLCTAFMAMSMMLPGLVAGYLQEALGYIGFFTVVALCCLVTVGVTFLVKVDPSFGRKR